MKQRRRRASWRRSRRSFLQLKVKTQDQAKQPEHEDGKEKGSIVCIEKIKKKLTSHTKHEDDDEKGNLVN